MTTDNSAYLDATKQPIIIGVSISFIIIIILCVVLRIWARSISRVGFGWDDWLCLAGVPFALLSPIFGLIQLSNGFGKHEETVSPEALRRYAYLFYILLLFYNPGLCFFKYSILAFYLRVFPIVTWLRYSVYALAILVTMWFLGTEFILIFRCSPISAAWTPSPGKCISEQTIFITQSVPTIFFDVAIITLPISLIWGLRLARSSRIGVVAMFLLGGLVTLMSIVRLTSTLTSSDSDLTCKRPYHFLPSK
ncbi:uncharacterized protein K441DRAFT_729703 [Cenococcum geophilum 1.58]|uniref:uncharacterized protein n=1 Tax=Cenococcum geophilum 1.58 TaxID=794803 RepID=UPI00358E022D|nr:hypothetical protein K441DRAFT_729703 [Cenococcum geophilum 1.58]